MASEMIEWMADKILKQFNGDGRKNFLLHLKNNREYVIEVMAQDVERLSNDYVFETGKCIQLNAEAGDISAFVTCAKYLVEYMQDDTLASELARI